MNRRTQALLGPPPADQGSIEQGTVGWTGDDSQHYRAEPDEVLLVKVTLFRGYNPDRDPKPEQGRAGGLRVWARVSRPMIFVPEVGAAVIVAVPAGGWTAPGAPMIIGCAATTPPNQFSGANKAKQDFGPDVDVVIKARSITLTDYEDRYITIGPRYGIQFGDADGNGLKLKGGKWTMYAASGDPADVKAALHLSTSKVQLSFKDGDGKMVGLTLTPGGTFTIQGQMFSAATANGQLGAAATPVSGLQYGPGMGVPSTSWFVQS